MNVTMKGFTRSGDYVSFQLTDQDVCTKIFESTDHTERVIRVDKPIDTVFTRGGCFLVVETVSTDALGETRWNEVEDFSIFIRALLSEPVS